ncbi:hypothetical protein H072_10082 [Dactylellina haptotyla CBS 200.50]|uniref:Uncharacterized protein n=1 Tax=Dactylellina haptotyla (strain CBS 200.50) TaxID=1284197 RepID=S8A089_DACHA|nr:hypothetical protein H072_10082 [Dactylellina haptotyla CBS 200.50]
MALKRGLLCSAWLSLVTAMPVAQGGEGGDSPDSDLGLSPPTDVFSPQNGMQPTTAGQHRTTTQTRPTNLQTHNNPFGLQNEVESKLDTSLRRLFGSDSQRDSGRIDSGLPLTLNGKLAPPGMFSQPQGQQTGWPWEYIERLPPDSGLMKTPTKGANVFDTNHSTPNHSSPPSVRLSGVQETIFRNDMQPGYQNSRNIHSNANPKYTSYTTPRGSSKWVNYAPSNEVTMANNGHPMEEQDFVKSFRQQYPEYAETISFIEDGDPRVSTPEKQTYDNFKFTPTPRIHVPPLASLPKGGTGAAGMGLPGRRESDLLPGDLENVLSHFVESTDDFENADGLESKASCDVTDAECVEGGTSLPLAGVVSNGFFQVRNPARISGIQRGPPSNPIPSTTKPTGFGGGPKGGPRMATTSNQEL